jgi:hypothetical protein
VSEPVTRAFQISRADHVATLLDDATDQVTISGDGGAAEIALAAPIKLGHKVALRAIPAGEPIVKYGVPIGVARQAIAAGEWVHLHNCASRYDERSADFDIETGAAQDRHYD